MRDDPAPMTATASGLDETMWLLGQPQLSDYLDFVHDRVVGGAGHCPRALADEWRAANDLYYDLENEEAGIADEIDCRPLPDMLAPLAAELMASPQFRRTFDTLPVTIEMVELEKLMVSQTYVTATFSERRAATLDRRPDPETLFRYCQPLTSDRPDVRIERSDDETYIFSSACTDLRPHRVQLLTADKLSNLESTGPITAAIALIVGFGSNYLTAIRSDHRLVLHNGYHRAHSLIAAGIRHAPCLVQTVTRKDELRIAASEEVSADPAFFFRSARPPLMKDFFNPRLAKRYLTRPSRTVVEIDYKLTRTVRVEAERG